MYANRDSFTDQLLQLWEDLDNETIDTEPDDDYSGDDEFYRDMYGE